MPRDALPPVTGAPISAELVEPANWIARQLLGAFDAVAPDMHRDVLLLQFRLVAWSHGVRELERRAGPEAPRERPAPRGRRGLIGRLMSWADRAGPWSGAL